MTIDHRIRGRDRDLDFCTPAPQDQYVINPRLTVLEVKANERVPAWFTDLASRNLDLWRISKYCQSIEAHSRSPRSMFHVNEGRDLSLDEAVNAGT